MTIYVDIYLIISLICILLFYLLWRFFRLRRAIFILSNQISWTIQHASKEKLVLEVGSGHNPHIRSDVLCDKYLFDDAHRADKIIIDRPLVVGDACALPFKTKVFDVIISKQMIEHLDVPQLFFEEAGRVAKSGFFSAPTALREKLMSEPQHRWLIEYRDGELVFTVKQEPIYDNALKDFFEETLISSTYKYDQLTLNNREKLDFIYLWEGMPRCKVIGNPSHPGFVHANIHESSIVRKISGIEKARSYAKTIVRNLMHFAFKSILVFEWKDILACPKCHNDVIVTDGSIQCIECLTSYPIKDGIPIMLIEYASG